MPQVIFTPAALKDLGRLHDFLNQKNPASAKKSALAITQAIKILQKHPHIGRLVQDMPQHYRELVIHFGSSGYIARYRLQQDRVVILAIRHQKELQHR